MSKFTSTPIDTPSRRPVRLRMADFSGKICTLPSGPESYEKQSTYFSGMHIDEGHSLADATHVLMGTGGLWGEKNLADYIPHAQLLAPKSTVFVLESPEFAKSISPEQQGFSPEFPMHWKIVTDFESIAQWQQQEQQQEKDTSSKPLIFWWYSYNTRLFPDFWWPLLGQVLQWQWSNTCSVSHGATESRSQNTSERPRQKILLGCAENQLLEREVKQAFTELGYEVMPVRCGGFSGCARAGDAVAQGRDISHAEPILHAVHEENTALFFSINAQGLDSEGKDFALLQALGIPVALWFVDNPWHILAALRLPWWKKTPLFATDASFIEPLQKEGAEKIFHLPLATAQHMWIVQEHDTTQQQYRNTPHIKTAKEASCVFVGRSSFPQKESFFAAAKVAPELLIQAQQCIREGKTLPHYHWWTKQMAMPSHWLHPALRSVGLGAEQSAQYQRVHWLNSFAQESIAIFGDAQQWQKLLPSLSPTSFHESVDYYGELANLYSAAPAVLNVTSLLLPAGLTQRHFDVWAAGGFLYSNITQGLEIFPQELVQPMAFSTPEKMKKALHTLPHSVMQDLKRGWQEELRAKHSYAQRMSFVLLSSTS